MSVSHASFSWCESNPPVLSNLDMEVTRGQLVVVIGSVGSGKSSLLAALLGEMRRREGRHHIYGTIGYTC